jgi:hypothetical protein
MYLHDKLFKNLNERYKDSFIHVQTNKQTDGQTILETVKVIGQLKLFTTFSIH